MDILILLDGQQTGPHRDEDVHALLQQGAARLSDMAWRPGMADWLPLHAVLGVDPESAPAQPKAAVAAEPANPRQKAFLTYLGIPFSSDLSKEQAAQFVNEAMKDAKHAAHIQRWEAERLRLFPDLFADEIKARKENRAQRFLAVCHTQGVKWFEGVSKAHTQVLVGYLDVHHPNWDEHDTATRYFFAALSEKFPQLVKKAAKGRFTYPDGPKVASELSSAVHRGRVRQSPLMAAVRGVVIGLLVLGVLYGANVIYERYGAAAQQTSAGETKEAAVPPTTPSPAAANVAEEKKTEATPPAETAKHVAATPTNPATPAPTAEPATPAPAATPAPIPSLFDPAPAAAATPSAPATPATRTSVTITKATEVSLRFGKSTLAEGTLVPLVKVDGANALVRFGPDVIPVPVANTDLGEKPVKPPE